MKRDAGLTSVPATIDAGNSALTRQPVITADAGKVRVYVNSYGNNNQLQKYSLIFTRLKVLCRLKVCMFYNFNQLWRLTVTIFCGG